jgi:hypothetical protein
LISALIAALFGLFGGIGSTVVWEVVLKPWLERRKLARMLAPEIQHTLAHLSEIQQLRRDDPSIRPESLGAYNTAYHAVLPEISALPENALEGVISLYRRFAHLENIMAALANSEPTAQSQREAERLLEGRAALLNSLDQNIARVLREAGKVLPLLIRLAGEGADRRIPDALLRTNHELRDSLKSSSRTGQVERQRGGGSISAPEELQLDDRKREFLRVLAEVFAEHDRALDTTVTVPEAEERMGLSLEEVNTIIRRLEGRGVVVVPAASFGHLPVKLTPVGIRYIRKHHRPR